MTTLVIDELRTTLEQDFEILERMQITTIRPVLYIHSAPAGSVIIKIKSGSTVLSEATMLISDIISEGSLSDYSWGSFSFTLNEEIVLHPETTYTIELSGSGYSYSDSSYIGMVKPHENEINELQDSTANPLENAFGFELWGYK